MSAAGPSDIRWPEGSADGQPTGRDRREAERTVAYWEDKRHRFGQDLTIAELDLAATNGPSWSNRFLIAVDPMVERSSLVLYGPSFARLLHLPPQARPNVPMRRQLPRRFADVFLHGCTEAQKKIAPVRLEGEAERYDQRIEQYRAVFIPIGVKPNSLTFFAFGAFNSRTVERAST